MSSKVDQRTVDIVNGYMRQAQLLLPYHLNTYYNIPPLVNNICLNFYNNPDYFTVCNRGLTLKNQHKMIDTASINYGTCYGYVDITNVDEDCKYVWTFNVLSYPRSCLLAIGIDASNKAHYSEDFHDCGNKNPYYGLELYHHASGELYSLQERGGAYGPQVGDGDVIKMELSMTDKTIKYYINDNDHGVAFSDIIFGEDTIYHMAVYVHHVDIELTDFVQTKS